MAVEAARWGARGPNKKGYSHKISTQKGELDNSSMPSRINDERQPAREKHHESKERTAYSR
jgi:hypothetical protein